MVAAFDDLKSAQPKHNFVVGIRDDVTHTSLEVGPEVDTIPEGTKQCLFWGLGTDGTVGANKAAIKTISSNTPLFGQGHFAYDSHKGGGVTMSHIRFGPSPHMPEYEIQQGADYIACGNTSYVTKFDMIKTARVREPCTGQTPYAYTQPPNTPSTAAMQLGALLPLFQHQLAFCHDSAASVALTAAPSPPLPPAPLPFRSLAARQPGSTFLLNTPWVGEELEQLLPAKMKRTIAERNLNFYTIDATRVAKEIGLGQRINTVMQSGM